MTPDIYLDFLHSRHVRIAFFIPLIILAVLSAPFLITDLDLTIQREFYDMTTTGWPTGELFPWRFLYTYGPIPAIILGITSAAILLLGIGNPVLAKYRRLSAYFFFVLLIGSGLITNAILKDQWGRPRPKQVTEFNGTEAFERILHYDGSSEGKSFPCGHATMGFYFLALAPLLSRRRRWLAVFFSLLLGLLIGIARVTQGGHFPSDVLWAAAVMWFTSLLFYQLFKLNESLWWQPKAKLNPNTRTSPKWLPWVSPPLLLILLAIAGTIWPYDKEILSTPSESPTSGAVLINFQGEDVLEIKTGEQFEIISYTNGHRAPKSKLRVLSQYTPTPQTITTSFQRRGWFSELNVRTVITIPPEMTLTIQSGPEVSTIILPHEDTSTQVDPASTYQPEIIRR